MNPSTQRKILVEARASKDRVSEVTIIEPFTNKSTEDTVFSKALVPKKMITTKKNSLITRTTQSPLQPDKPKFKLSRILVDMRNAVDILYLTILNKMA